MTQNATEPGLPAPKERRRLREAADLTHEEIAEAVGVTATTVRSWESGRTDPRGRTREAYAELLSRLSTTPAPVPPDPPDTAAAPHTAEAAPPAPENPEPAAAPSDPEAAAPGATPAPSAAEALAPSPGGTEPATAPSDPEAAAPGAIPAPSAAVSAPTPGAPPAPGGPGAAPAPGPACACL
ncbi:helix-turn-helix transcriptional regulator, partial [Streptomyces sp. NPDC060031]|uniref:helix-turn-helix transcriptional regulator n=1 Tax=Streptomyces sp. NPDC060031 TaxID=3347043 RepID=UPI0036B06CE5